MKTENCEREQKNRSQNENILYKNSAVEKFIWCARTHTHTHRENITINVAHTNCIADEMQ